MNLYDAHRIKRKGEMGMNSVSKLHRHNLNHRRSIWEIVTAVLTAVLLLAVYFTVSVLLVQKQSISIYQLPAISKIGLFLSTLIGALICAKRVKHGKLFCAVGTGAASCMILWIIGLAAGGGEAVSFGVPAMIVCSAAVVGGLLGARQRRSNYL